MHVFPVRKCWSSQPLQLQMRNLSPCTQTYGHWTWQASVKKFESVSFDIDIFDSSTMPYEEKVKNGVELNIAF